MLDFFINLNPMIQAFIATLFTWSITMLGASLVFLFKKVNKNVMDAMLGFAAGVMISASFFSLLNPGIEMAESLNMIPWVICTIGFMGGGVLLYIGDKIFNFFDKRFSKEDNNKTSIKRCLMLIFSITLHNIPEGLAVGVAFGSIIYGLDGANFSSACLIAPDIGSTIPLKLPNINDFFLDNPSLLRGTLTAVPSGKF